jgi:hypothetical protein
MKDSDLNLWDRFLEFEQEFELFKLKDSKGTYVWDIIRFEVYINLLWDYKNRPNIKNKYGLKITLLLKTLFLFIKFLFDQKNYYSFFFLTSRNKNGQFFIDKNAQCVIDITKTSKLFFESAPISNKTLYEPSYPTSIQSLFRKIYKTTYKFDTESLINLIGQHFPNSKINSKNLIQLINDFYSDKYFYNWVFKSKKVQHIYITQNGIQKGLFAAANNLGIPTIEFQHGIVDSGHIAYNYPININNSEYIYFPKVILSLSDFWFNDINTPAKILPVGNDLFSNISNNHNNSKIFTVISADIFGLELLKFIKELYSTEFDYDCYFKLHPNQYSEVSYFENELSGIPNVKIITDEISVEQLTNISNAILSIQSTALYEALQAGVKAIIYRKSSYMRHSHIFNLPNVYLINNTMDFIEALEEPIKITNYKFFKQFNKDLFKEAIQ